VSARSGAAGTRAKLSIVLAGIAAGALAVVGLRRRRGSETPTTDAREIVRLVLEEPWKGNWDVIESFVSPDYLGHDPAEDEPVRGPAGVRARIERYLTAFPDGGLSVDDQLADGDRVATRWTARGIQTGEIAGVAATGREITVSGVTVSRLEGDLVVEDWTSWDTLGMLVQLGAVPAHAEA